MELTYRIASLEELCKKPEKLNELLIRLLKELSLEVEKVVGLQVQQHQAKKVRIKNMRTSCSQSKGNRDIMGRLSAQKELKNKYN